MRADGRCFLIKDALEERFADLDGRDDIGMLGDCGSSITIRLEVCTMVSINFRFTNTKKVAILSTMEPPGKLCSESVDPSLSIVTDQDKRLSLPAQARP